MAKKTTTSKSKFSLNNAVSWAAKALGTAGELDDVLMALDLDSIELLGERVHVAALPYNIDKKKNLLRLFEEMASSPHNVEYTSFSVLASDVEMTGASSMFVLTVFNVDADCTDPDGTVRQLVKNWQREASLKETTGAVFITPPARTPGGMTLAVVGVHLATLGRDIARDN